MSDVFISYSRTDSDFVRKLFDALNTSQREAWVDWRGIDYSTKWWEEIVAGIEGADNFVVIISPDSLQSVYCHREIEHARRMNKRIIPLLYKAIDEAEVVGTWYTDPKLRPYEQVARANWDAIKAIQWIDTPRLGDLDKVVKALLDTVDTDAEQVRLHTRLLLRIREWESRGRSPDAVLRGTQLEDYERWLRKSDESGLKPRPTDEQRAFIAESRRIEDDERARQAQRERRTQQFRTAAVLLGLFSLLAVVAAVGLGVVTTQTGNALATATVRQGQAQGLADAANATAAQANQSAQAANTQVVLIGQTLTPVPATLTPIPVTLTAVGRKVEAANLQARAVEELRKAQVNDSTGGNNDFIALLAIRALKYGYYPVADQALMQAAENLPLRAFRGHEGIVYSARFSPDDRYVVTAGGDSTARLWDAYTGALVRTFDHRVQGLKPKVVDAVFSPTGSTIATASSDRIVRLWDATTGSLIRTFSGHGQAVMSVGFSPDGKYLLTGSQDKTARLWNVDSGQVVHTFSGHTDTVYSVTFSPDGQFALTGSNDTTARLWNVASGESIKTFNTQRGGVFSVAFSPDSRRILTGGEDRTAQVVSVDSGEVLATFRQHTSVVNSVTFSPDGRYALSGSDDKTARLWDTASGKLVRTFSGHPEGVLSVAYSHDGQNILTASYDTSARLWAVNNTALTQTFTGVPSPTVGLAVSPDGRYSLAGNDDGRASLWDIASNQVLRVLSGHTNLVLSDAFSPDGRYALTGSADNTARLWDIASGQSLGVFSGHNNYVLSAVFSPDGQQVLTGSWDGTARLWKTSDQKLIRTLTDPNADSQVNGAVFSPDGRYILTGVGGNASGNGDNVARLWDATSGQLVRTFTGHTNGVDSVAFSPDGRYVLTGSRDWTARLWDATNGQLVQTYQGHTDTVLSVAFSPDGKTVVTGSGDKTARLWDTTSGNLVRTFVGHTAEVVNVVYRADGRSVLTKSVDRTVRLWDVNYRDFVDRICPWLVRDFTDAERTSVGIVDHDPTCPQLAASAGTALTPSPTGTPSSRLPVWTPIASPTAMLMPTVTRTATSSATASPTVIATTGQAQTGTVLYGPVSGELDPRASDPQAAQRITQITQKNFIAQVRFTVPRAATTVDESYSFLFRLTAANGYALAVYQDGAWLLFTTEKSVARGTASPTGLAPGSTHTMRLEVIDGAGSLYLDGILVATLDLSEIQTAGAVGLTASEGDKVQFEDFTIWSVQ